MSRKESGLLRKRREKTSDPAVPAMAGRFDASDRSSCVRSPRVAGTSDKRRRVSGDSRGHAMDEKSIRSWDEFFSVAETLDGWAFRGQRDVEWELFSSLSRHLQNFVPDKTCWEEREARAIRIFRRKAHNYVSFPRILDDDLRCLALMQHHGAPTRLLDFTKSPYVAAFFALENATGDAAVFALNTPVLWNAAPTGAPELTRSRIDPRESGNFETYFAQNRHELVWMGEPNEMDRRLLAQSGTFVMPGVVGRPVEEILRGYPSPQPLLRKLILPAKKIRQEFMRSLYRMNITNATLFPDLDGLAKSIAFELEIIWQGLVDDPADSTGTIEPCR